MKRGVTDSSLAGQDTFQYREKAVCTERRWLRGRRPELYRSLTVPTGHELNPIGARFSEEPTQIHPKQKQAKVDQIVQTKS
jgi:hypothetical protein